jgi:6-phosphogluconate dehydrogenase
MKADIGLIGLAVMGENLVLNMESKGFCVAVYNRTTSKVKKFVDERGKNKNIIASYSIKELIENLSTPRKVMLMVKAGDAVDSTINQIIPYLDKGDIIIDGGNSNYMDTQRRYDDLTPLGFYYIGTGVSGGEEGALLGPSLMPGGSEEAWPLVKPILQGISAKVENNVPCCDWIGKGGAGHFVKMVHNGIEYGDMQIIAEIYDIMRNVLKLETQEIAEIFTQWNTSELDSYLIEITSKILAYKEGDNYLINYILDAAGQKGTGKWTVINALNEGIPLTLITASVFARSLSAQKDKRVIAAKEFKAAKPKIQNYNKEELLLNLKNALYVSKIISYAQGFELIKMAGEEKKWNLNLGSIALMWRGGCIIRSVLLNKINTAFSNNTNLENLILDDYFKNELIKNNSSLRQIVVVGALNGVATPSLSAALSWFDGYTSENTPANLIQAQRDFFGAHTYERVDTKRGEYFHTNWTGKGGNTAASIYTV